MQRRSLASSSIAAVVVEPLRYLSLVTEGKRNNYEKARIEFFRAVPLAVKRLGHLFESQPDQALLDSISHPPCEGNLSLRSIPAAPVKSGDLCFSHPYSWPNLDNAIVSDAGEIQP